jgi:hypothetical protein
MNNGRPKSAIWRQQIVKAQGGATRHHLVPAINGVGCISTHRFSFASPLRNQQPLLPGI